MYHGLHKHNFIFLIMFFEYMYGVERTQHAATSEKHSRKAPANQENVFINLTAGAANAHNTNK